MNLAASGAETVSSYSQSGGTLGVSGATLTAATYALSGGMERVADEVFLLTPSNVKVSEEERQRLADHGLVSP